jgi:hypothetical protein
MTKLIFYTLLLLLVHLSLISAKPSIPKIAILNTINQAKLDKVSIDLINQQINKLCTQNHPHYQVLSKDEVQHILDNSPPINVENCIEQCEIEIGSLANARYVLASKISKKDKHYLLSVTLFDTVLKKKLSLQKIKASSVDLISNLILSDLNESIQQIESIQIKAQEIKAQEINSDQNIFQPQDDSISHQNPSQNPSSSIQHPPLQDTPSKFAINTGIGAGTSYSGLGAQVGMSYLGKVNSRLLLSYGALQSTTSTANIGISFQSYFMQPSTHTFGLGLNYLSYRISTQDNQSTPYQVTILSLDLLYKLDIGEKNGFELIIGGSLESRSAKTLITNQEISNLSGIKPMFVMGLNYIFAIN